MDDEKKSGLGVPPGEGVRPYRQGITRAVARFCMGSPEERLKAAYAPREGEKSVPQVIAEAEERQAEIWKDHLVPGRPPRGEPLDVPLVVPARESCACGSPSLPGSHAEAVCVESAEDYEVPAPVASGKKALAEAFLAAAREHFERQVDFARKFLDDVNAELHSDANRGKYVLGIDAATSASSELPKPEPTDDPRAAVPPIIPEDAPPCMTHVGDQRLAAAMRWKSAEQPGLPCPVPGCPEGTSSRAWVALVRGAAEYLPPEEPLAPDVRTAVMFRVSDWPGGDSPIVWRWASENEVRERQQAALREHGAVSDG